MTIYDTMPEADYHADPAPEPSLSSSIAKLLATKTPLHAWLNHPRLNPEFQPSQSQQFDLGSLAHKLILGRGAEVEIIDAADWRTKAAKAARDEAREAGRIPALAHQHEAAERMAIAFHDQLAKHGDASDMMCGGAVEQTIVWEEDGIHCRARLDHAKAGPPAWIDDLKTTAASAAPDDFARTAINLGYDIQDAFYRRAFRAAYGVEASLRFAVIELEPPHLLSVFQLTPQAMALADQKVRRAAIIWRHCMKTGNWPGYPSRTIHIDAPGWHAAQWDDRVERENLAGGGSVLEYLDKHALHWKPIA